MKFRQAFCRACTNHAVDRRNLRQRYVSTDGKSWLMIVREIARRLILLRRIFAARRMFVSVIVVVRMHCADRAQIVMPAQMRAPRSTGHDKRAYEQDEGQNPEHDAAITGRSPQRNVDDFSRVLWSSALGVSTEIREWPG